MSLSLEAKTQVDQVAGDSLGLMDRVASIASAELHRGSYGAASLTGGNTFTAARTAPSLANISMTNMAANRRLTEEPAIARVLVAGQDGKRDVYFICRATPVTGSGALLASYTSPAGRLAALPVGADLRLPNGRVVEVIERMHLRPRRDGEGWDSKNSVYEGEHVGPITIESLRALLRQVVQPDKVEDLLSKILADEQAAANVVDGIRRNRITKMGLRDQPVLDQYQDEIFRLPLNQRLLILGPPGTGKTTTLIRRLGQKLDVAVLPADEQRVVSNASQTTGLAHEQSWLMFTPTELLKQYLKEAFNRESVTAPDQRLKTWSDYRRDLGRNTLGFLRTATSKGAFTLKEAAATLREDARAKPTDWFSDFDGWQRQAFIAELQQSALRLSGSVTSPVVTLGRRLGAVLDKANPAAMADLFLELAAEVTALQALSGELKAACDAKVDAALNLAINRDDQFIDHLSALLDQLRQAADAEDLDDADELEGEDDDLAPARTGRSATISAFQRVVRTQARAVAAKRSINKASRNAKILDWLGARTLSSADQAAVGGQLLVLAAARRFVNPIKRYLDRMPTRYRAFRREAQEIEAWYQADGFAAADLHPLELDVLLLSSLRAAGEMLARPTIARRVDEAYWSALKTVQGLYKHQILVDEATDFSPIQLACMAALAHPQLRSFFACGDFNQRLTTWGSRSIADMHWVLPDLAIREVSVAYRQSRQLNELARAIIEQLGGTASHVSLPPHVDSEGEMPALLEQAVDVAGAVTWLAGRIAEIEQFVEQLPSTAIFVNTEADVQPLADALNSALEDSNIRVVACPKGQVMGQENDVRVFDIQHIKGLEFEAVFFIGIDRLAASHPALFDKYLYVGTTRAATYLGLTCDGDLPPVMEPLRTHFAADWTPR